jgi:type VI secretion system protein ImpB
MGNGSSQDFIERNRPPRVHIKYEVHRGGAREVIDLPFVMGVLADLSGNPEEPLPPVSERSFQEIDVDNFDATMKAMKPRVSFRVPNTLTGEGELPVDITFESMEDFSPARIAEKVEPLRRLLEARKQLSNLLTHLDVRPGVEGVLEKLLQDPALMRALSSEASSEGGSSSSEE